MCPRTRKLTSNVNATTRCLVVGLTICSWLATSNHCALMAVAAPVADLQSACPYHSKPTNQKEQSSQVQCCKILRAVTPVATKSWARDDAQFSDADLHFEQFGRIALSYTTPAPLLLDTGPPGATSFAELILQRSLFTHAPPSLA
jgi:hypothetical protein